MFGYGVHSLLHGKKLVNEVGLFEGVGRWGLVIFDDQVGDFVTSVVRSELNGVLRVATFDIIFDGAVLLSIFAVICFLYFLFNSCCSDALLHKFHISYSRTEWNLLSSLSNNCNKDWKETAVKQSYKLKKKLAGT